MRIDILLVAAAVACSAAGCGSRDNEKVTSSAEPKPAADQAPAPTPAKPKETRVFEVKSSDDLYNLRTEYMKLWESGFDGTLEVQIAAGEYSAINWQLLPPSDSARKSAPSTIDVVLRGDGKASPPPPTRIRARSLRIEDLVLVGQYQTWIFTIDERFEMKNAALIDGRFSDAMDEGSPFVTIAGFGPRSGKPLPVEASIESSWFIRNFETDNSATMLLFTSDLVGKSYWKSISIDDCAFLGNAFASALELQYVLKATVANSLFYKNWPDGAFFHSRSSADITIENSVLVAESIDHLARHGSESPPIKLAGSSKIYVKNWKAGAAPPASLEAHPNQIHDQSALSANLGAITEATKLQPADGVPPAELKKKLDAAFRP